MAKAYNRKGERFYGERRKKFKRKLKLFNRQCIPNGVGDADKIKAFPVMLTDQALQYYFDQPQCKPLNFEILCDAIRKRFITEEHTFPLLSEWKLITLKTTMLEDSEKKPI